MRFLIQELTRLVRFAESTLFDWWLNIDTHGKVSVGGEASLNRDAFDYETTAHIAIRRAIWLAHLTRDDTVYELGCGKGRALCHYARRSVRRVVGIEISKQLCDIAAKNAGKLRGKRSPVEIINADVSLVDTSDGTVYYMFNPFGEKTLRDVLENIKVSHDFTKQRVKIIYMNAEFAYLFDHFRCFEVKHDYRRANGQRVLIYQTIQPDTSNNEGEHTICG